MLMCTTDSRLQEADSTAEFHQLARHYSQVERHQIPSAVVMFKFQRPLAITAPLQHQTSAPAPLFLPSILHHRPGPSHSRHKLLQTHSVVSEQAREIMGAIA